MLLGAGALLAFGLYLFRSLEAAAPEKSAAVAGSVPLASPLASAATRALRIDVTPRDARVFVDERPVSGSPAVATVSAGAEHVIRIERDGHESVVRKLVVSEDVQLDVALPSKEANEEPSAPAASATSSKGKGRARAFTGRVVAAPPPAAPAAAAPAAAGKNCDPPYFFANGNKTYKPECI
jgi:hypothetical protein